MRLWYRYEEARKRGQIEAGPGEEESQSRKPASGKAVAASAGTGVRAAGRDCRAATEDAKSRGRGEICTNRGRFHAEDRSRD
jgi:hypothetical protein